MHTAKAEFYEKQGNQLVKALKSRHAEAYYCGSREDALAKALELIPEGATVSWGGTVSAVEIGLKQALLAGNYRATDRDALTTREEKEQAARAAFSADFFLMGANAMSMDGQMVTIDGMGNRAAALIYGPKRVIVLVGMNKVCPDLDSAVKRARNVAAPMNEQRFHGSTPCAATGVCADCKAPDCICNQIVITRGCRPEGRIIYLVVGDELGF